MSRKVVFIARRTVKLFLSIRRASVTTAPMTPPSAPTFAEAVRFWLKLVFISFGGPAGQIATYAGWLLHGTRGGIAAGTIFCQDESSAPCYAIRTSMIRPRKTPVEKFVATTEKPRTFPIAIGAFFGGALLMWVVMQFFTSAPTVKPPPITKGAPDVAKMPDAQAAATLGNWEYDHANWPAAIHHYERAVAAGYSTADLLTDLGTAYKNLGDRERALSQYGLAQRKDAFHQNSLFNQAIVYAELHNSPKAIAAAREYLRRFPQGHGADSARTLISELEGDGADAEKRLSEFLTAPKPVRAQP